LTQLSLDNNHLSGPIPPELGNLTELREIFLHLNELSGPIPKQLGNLHKLLFLSLHSNKLFGTVPTELGALGNQLKILSLRNNLLDGPIPSELGRLSGLTTFFLDSNRLNGTIPSSLGQLNLSASFFLSNNNLSSSLPSTLSRLKQATETLGLPGSQSPSWLQNFTKLAYLELGSAQAASDTESLDLSSVPSQCQVVRWMGGPISSIRFWDACTSGSGCVVNLIGSASRLSRQTRRYICLNKVSVFLEGDGPALVTSGVDALPGSIPSLANAYGTYILDGSRFLDQVRWC
jgi:hypothetical protein